jgi:hypothetical protein
MLIFVIVFNLVLTLFNLYCAFSLWKLRWQLRKVTGTINYLEDHIHGIFAPAPEIVLKGQQGTSLVRQRYAVLVWQLQTLGQLLALIQFGLKAFGWSLRLK